jgi:hypothetical protein
VKRLEKYFVTKTEFAETIDKVMAKIDARFDAMDKRFDAMQKEMDRRFEESNRRFEALQKEMDRRFELVDKRFEAMQKEMDKRFDAVQKEISDIKTTLHHWTSAIEEDAQEVIKYYLNKEGIIISMLSNLQVAKDGIATEIDVYGANEEYCVIGEATVNLTDNKFDQLEDAIKNLKKYAPEKLRPKIIRVLFADRVYPEAIERAKNENIWLIKAGKELVPLKEVLQKL